MATSTQRLLMIVIAINLVISLSLAIYQAPEVVDYGTYQETIELGANTADTTEGEQTSTTPENLNEEGSFGSSLRMGRVIFGLFIRGLVALPTVQGMYDDDPVTKIGWDALLIIWSLMYILIAIEIFILIKNKKVT